MGKPATPYDHPELRCDVVMKGGVTSGVVYPLTVCELARKYRFMHVGGTSAGAIAAAFTAAAEYRRRRGDSAGFCEIERLPRWLGARTGGRSHLLTLFAPDAATRALFEVLTALGTRAGLWPRARRVAWAAMKGFPLAILAGLAPGVGLAAWGYEAGATSLRYAFASGAPLAFVGATVAFGIALTLRIARRLPGNLFGLCTGLAARDTTAPSLTPWLADTLDRIAGLDDPARPLTFGDLRRADAEGVHLEMMTTGLTHGRPFRLPLEEERFLFDPAEMRRLFPERIVQFMETHPRAVVSAREAAERERGTGLRPLPAPDDLPVVVAVRMSLSFPLLLSAVPLWAVDRTRRRPRGPDGHRRAPAPERCWFADGGLCSNFPVHFFDRPLPRWPTFAVNLRGFHPDYPRQDDDAANVWMPRTNRGGIEVVWTRIEAPRSGLVRLARFLGAAVATTQNWSDNAQTRVPGYRDRVVHILHAEDEGGLNLDMPPETIARLAERGRAAGALLRRRFAEGGDGSGLDWDNHRWVRLRSALALLEETLGSMRVALSDEDSEAPGMTYAQLIERGADEPPASYRLRSAPEREQARRMMDDVCELVDRWESEGVSVGNGAPRPRPEIRIRPRV